MTRIGLICLALVLAIAAAPGMAADSPQVMLLQNQIKLLKAQQTATHKEVHTWYENLIKGGKLSEAAAAKERDNLTKQEKQLLNNATSEEDKKSIKAQYDSLRAALTGEVKMDATLIAKLRDLEKSHEKQVDLAFKAKILQLENQVKILKAMMK